jgi:hypothetical protein
VVATRFFDPGWPIHLPRKACFASAVGCLHLRSIFQVMKFSISFCSIFYFLPSTDGILISKYDYLQARSCSLSLLPSTSGGNWIPDYLVTKIVLLIEMPS